MTTSITRADSTSRGALILLLILALAVRVGWVMSRPTSADALAILPDQVEYLELGRNLLHGKGLSFRDGRFDETVLAFRAPGYPLLVAACGGSVRAVRAVQALLDSSTVLAAYLLARRWLSRGPSLFATAMIAVNPFLIYFSGLILSETLFASMLTWGMMLMARPRAASLAWWGGAILLAISVLVRPSAMLLPVILATAGVATNRDLAGAYLWRWGRPAAIMLVLTCAVLLPWGLRNHRVLGSWVFTTTNSGITFYDGFNPRATGASDQTFLRTMPELGAMSETQRSEYLSQLAWRYVREHPRRVIDLSVVKIARTWSPMPLSDDYGSRRNSVIALGYMLPFYVLILLGLWFGAPPTAAKVFLLLPAIYFTVAHALTVGSLRYRIPADVPMAIVAAAGASRISGGKTGTTGAPPHTP